MVDEQKAHELLTFPNERHSPRALKATRAVETSFPLVVVAEARLGTTAALPHGLGIGFVPLGADGRLIC